MSGPSTTSRAQCAETVQQRRCGPLGCLVSFEVTLYYAERFGAVRDLEKFESNEPVNGLITSLDLVDEPLDSANHSHNVFDVTRRECVTCVLPCRGTERFELGRDEVQRSDHVHRALRRLDTVVERLPVPPVRRSPSPSFRYVVGHDIHDEIASRESAYRPVGVVEEAARPKEVHEICPRSHAPTEDQVDVRGLADVGGTQVVQGRRGATDHRYEIDVLAEIVHQPAKALEDSGSIGRRVHLTIRSRQARRCRSTAVSPYRCLSRPRRSQFITASR